nr:retrovirus-related Pol polyprotein from transposon TNT 1-94 [Tanacetum cinerariifolium]
ANFLSEIEPKKVSEALKYQGWVDVMQKEPNQFYRNKVWTLVPLLYGKIAIGSKWVFKNKKDEHVITTKNKARVVAQGYSQKEGINYDETFTSVARMETIRTFLSFAAYINFKVYQIDVKIAFINGKLKEEVYVKHPPVFESSEFPDYVCKLDKALYELKQAPREWSSVKTPMVPLNNLGPNLVGKPVNETSYRGMIRYLKGTPTIGMYYLKCSGFNLKGYSDSDYAGCNMDRKSTSVMNGKKPLTFNFNTFTTSTGLDYNNGAYVAHPSPERILLTFVIQVLDENYSSTFVTKVDIEEIIYSDLVTKLLNKSRLRYVSYARFISYALEVLLGLEYTQDEKFRYLHGIQSNFNFSKDPSKVTKIEFTAYIIAVNNKKDLVSPLPLSAKKKKGKSQTPADRNLAFTASDEGAAKTMSFPEGPREDKDPEGLKPPIDMEPQTNPFANPLGIDAKYQADQTQSTRLRYRSLTENKVSACSRHQVTPMTSHLNVVKKIFKYLKGQPNLGLWYPRYSLFQLEAYSDSDYAGSHGDRKSTTGGCQFLGRRDANEKNLIQVLKIHTDENVVDLLTKAFDGPRFHYLMNAVSCEVLLYADHIVSRSPMLLVVLVHADGSYWWLYSSCWSHIRYALAHRPRIVFDSLVKQFWATATVHNHEAGPSQIIANIDGNEVVVTKSLIRTQLQLNDVDGLYEFTLIDVLDGIRVIGYPTDGSLTFYKAKLLPQWRFLIHTLIHWSKRHKVLMYPRFLQMILGIQTTDPSPRPTFNFTAKLFSNMKLNWDGPHMPLLASMLVVPVGGDGADAVAADAAAAHDPTPVREPTPMREPTPRPVRDPTHDSPRPPSPPYYPRSEESNVAPPTPAATAAGGAEDPTALTALSLKLDRCLNRVTSLENELGITKKVLGGAVLKLVTRVK